jgi:predicted peptidase
MNTGAEGYRRFAFVAILTVLLPSQPLPAAESGREAERSASAGSHTNLFAGFAGYKYLCFVPPTVASPGEKRPLILFLHGACPDENLEKLKHFGPIHYALDHRDFPFIAVAPASSRMWSLQKLDQLIQNVQARFQADPDRIYLTGYSNGGHAVWQLALAHPQRFAGIAPVAAVGDPDQASQRLRHLPVWIFHGMKDEVIPVRYGHVMADALTKAGAEVKTTFYEERGHDTWGPPYESSELYEWFLAHRRVAGKGAAGVGR